MFLFLQFEKQRRHQRNSIAPPTAMITADRSPIVALNWKAENASTPNAASSVSEMVSVAMPTVANV